VAEMNVAARDTGRSERLGLGVLDVPEMIRSGALHAHLVRSIGAAEA